MTSNILQLMSRVLTATFAGDTWTTWRAVLSAAFALPLTDDERAIVATLTQRQALPTSPVRELWLLLGRRSGKSIVAALCAVHATCCRTYTLAPGEVGVFMVIASDRRQARVVKKYVSGLFHAHPSLEVLLDRETADAIWLTNGLCIEIHTCSFRSLRGYTCIGAACDEIAFWDTEDSANPDHEVLVALRAAMASVPEAMLIGLTSVYARRGEVWRIYEKHFGKDSADVLVVNSATTTMNPTISQAVIDTAYADDPAAAAAEFGAEFRRDVEELFTREALAAVVVNGRLERPPEPGVAYVGFFDGAGGSGTDSATVAVAHEERREGRRVGVLDSLREVRPPFSPDAVIAEFAALLAEYRIASVVGDRWAGEWPRQAFAQHGIRYTPADRPKSDFYLGLLPLVMSGRCELLDHARLLKQLGGLERRTARGGKDAVDHGPRQHDDVANVAAAALVLAVSQPAAVSLAVPPPMLRSPAPVSPAPASTMLGNFARGGAGIKPGTSDGLGLGRPEDFL